MVSRPLPWAAAAAPLTPTPAGFSPAWHQLSLAITHLIVSWVARPSGGPLRLVSSLRSSPSFPPASPQCSLSGCFGVRFAHPGGHYVPAPPFGLRTPLWSLLSYAVGVRPRSCTRERWLAPLRVHPCGRLPPPSPHRPRVVYSPPPQVTLPPCGWAYQWGVARTREGYTGPLDTFRTRVLCYLRVIPPGGSPGQ